MPNKRVATGDARLRAAVGFVLVVARGIVLAAVISTASYHAGLNSASAALILLVGLVLNSLDCNLAESAAAALASVLTLDFFFMDPRFSLAIAKREDAITLVCLLVTSLVVTQLQTRIRYEMAQSKLQRENTLRLYELSQELLALNPAAEVSTPILRAVMEQFGLKGACLFDTITRDCVFAGECRDDLGPLTREAYVTGSDGDEAELGVTVRCLRVRGTIAGAISMEGLGHPEITGAPIAALAALTVERARAFRTATEAAAQAQAEALRSAILDALAHEIKTPLAAILTAAGGIRATASLAREQVELTELVESEASRLADLTSRLLRIARLDHEEIRPRLERVSVGEIAEPLWRRYKRLWADRRIEFQGDGSIEIEADRELVSLALGQLLENACRYSRPDAQIRLEAFGKDGMATFAVSNEGAPIRKGELERIFERFYRGDGARRSTPGTGLGLYVVRKIATAHGGTVIAVDGGMEIVTFTMALPMAAAEDPIEE